MYWFIKYTQAQIKVLPFSKIHKLGIPFSLITDLS